MTQKSHIATNSGESAFSFEIDINDYPQNARSKVTTKENIQKFIQMSGASVTMRGRHYPPGKKPGPNDEPRLHLVILKLILVC
jgi:ATP-dependent RNA helicase DDX46/PRP5